MKIKDRLSNKCQEQAQKTAQGLKGNRALQLSVTICPAKFTLKKDVYS